MANRTVVITGASSGFGQGAALKFAEAGDNVVLAARRKNLLEEVAERCEQLGPKAVAVKTDVSDPQEIAELAERAVSEFGRIDVWINNAGVGTIGRFDEAPLQDHEQVIRTNLLGTMYGSYEAIRIFRSQGHGTLINVGSVAGEVGSAYMSSYAASKFGVRGFGMALREELEVNGEKDIHVCTVEPDSHDTPFFEHAANYTGKKSSPLGTAHDPENVISTIFELASNPQDKVLVGSSGKLAANAHRVLPKVVETLMGKKSHKNYAEQTESAPQSSQSVREPMESGRDVYGGFTSKGEKSRQEHESGGRGWMKYLAFAVPTALLVAAVANRDRVARAVQDVTRTETAA